MGLSWDHFNFWLSVTIWVKEVGLMNPEIFYHSLQAFLAVSSFQRPLFHPVWNWAFDWLVGSETSEAYRSLLVTHKTLGHQTVEIILFYFRFWVCQRKNGKFGNRNINSIYDISYIVISSFQHKMILTVWSIVLFRDLRSRDSGPNLLKRNSVNRSRCRDLFVRLRSISMFWQKRSLW